MNHRLAFFHTPLYLVFCLASLGFCNAQSSGLFAQNSMEIPALGFTEEAKSIILLLWERLSITLRITWLKTVKNSFMNAIRFGTVGLGAKLLVDPT